MVSTQGMFTAGFTVYTAVFPLFINQYVIQLCFTAVWIDKSPQFTIFPTVWGDKINHIKLFRQI